MHPILPWGGSSDSNNHEASEIVRGPFSVQLGFTGARILTCAHPGLVIRGPTFFRPSGNVAMMDVKHLF